MSKQSKTNFSQAVYLALRMSGWLVGPIILAVWLGGFLDQRFQTKPWLFLISIGIAFCITSFGLVLETKKYFKEINKY